MIELFAPRFAVHEFFSAAIHESQGCVRSGDTDVGRGWPMGRFASSERRKIMSERSGQMARLP